MIEAKRSFNFETVMSHPSKIEILLRAKAAGFANYLIFVGTDDLKPRGDPRGSRRARCASGSHRRPLAPNHEIASRSDPGERQRADIRQQLRGYRCSAAYRANTGRALSQLIEPVPVWVEHFVLSPLKKG